MRLIKVIRSLGLVVSLLSVPVARAADCPDAVPGDSRERRAIAKEWFGQAERAEGSGDLVTASKAYQCSLRMVPHAFTAYNLGRVSEKSGDLELALDAYARYLKLAPEANDRADVEGKVKALEGRIGALNERRPPAGGDATKTAVPESVSGPPPPAPSAPLGRSEDMTITTAQSGGRSLRVVDYALIGTSVAALAGGLVMNVSARGKMSDCRSEADRAMGDQAILNAAARSCSAAKPRAYTSYALFGVAAMAAAVEAVLYFGTGTGDETTSVGLAPLPGGAALLARGRF